jgi:glycosyltransferase involved in cell wall biosynthesis
MRIAQVAPLYESVPPRAYGGTERVVSHLTEELVRQGHEVTLFASGDSVTTARLIAPCRRALRLDLHRRDPLAAHVLLLEQVFTEPTRFDLIHFHLDSLHYPLARRHRTPHVTTLHGRLDLPDLVPLYREFREMPVVSISDAQRAPLPWLNWQGTVYHGLPVARYPFGAAPEPYLAFVGRLAPEKGADRAIEIARRAGMPLKLVGKIDAADRAYVEAVLTPLLHEPFVEYLGELGEAEKAAVLGQASALLFPIAWPAALSHRVAGGVWPGHDRGHGLWDPDHRVSPGLGAGGAGGGGDRVCGGGPGGGRGSGPARARPRPSPLSAGL